MSHAITRGATGFGLRVLIIVTVLGIWEAVVRYFEIPSYILPAPSHVFAALGRGIQSGIYVTHIGVTLTETFLGFALGTLLAFILGTGVALSRRRGSRQSVALACRIQVPNLSDAAVAECAALHLCRPRDCNDLRSHRRHCC